MLSMFRNFNKDTAQLDELVSLEAFGCQLREAYERLQIEEPEFVDIQLKSLKRTIKARVADLKEARLKEVQSRLASLKTPGQKVSELKKEEKQLLQELAEV